MQKLDPVLTNRNLLPSVGIPLFYLELAVGQRMRKAAISCWNLVSPFAAGIGIASALVSFLVGLYYNAMVAWTMLYLWDSSKSALSKSELPFSICPRASSSLSPSARLSNRTAQCQVSLHISILSSPY